MTGLDLTPRDGFHVPSITVGQAEDSLVFLVGPSLLSKGTDDLSEMAGYYETLALFSDFAGSEDVVRHCKELASDGSGRVVLIGTLPAHGTDGVAEQAFDVANLPMELIATNPILVGIEDTALVAVVAVATHPEVFAGALAINPKPEACGAIHELVERMSAPAEVIASDTRGSSFLCGPDVVSDSASRLRASTSGPPGTVLRTVLFTDIVDSTRRAAAIGDREWAALLHEHHRLATQAVGRFGGRVVDTAGDGMLSIFERPALGLRCGLHLTGDVASTLALQIRAGAHAGVVELDEDGVSGIAVHFAARVQAAAAPGTVWTSGSLLPLVGCRGYSLLDRGEHVLKGIDGTPRLFEVSPT